MCAVDQSTMDKLSETVKRFLDEGRMFTAYDVTVETRNHNKMSLRHQDVGGAAHEVEHLSDAMDFGHDTAGGGTTKWQRTRRDVPGGNGSWTWVYHPDYADPAAFQFRGAQVAKMPLPAHVTGAKPAPANAIAQVNDGNTADSGGEQADGTFAVDFRRRLMIPTRYMKEAGIAPGDSCYVIADAQSNSVLITKEDASLLSLALTVQKVERDGELRLSSRTLASAALTDTAFVIETADKKLSGTDVKVVAVKKIANTAN
jgi:bifunctional DNA-binding transcriptional regulator/antitoxin component of YhaV-PrlF toxin-antitoxin module